MDLVLLFYVLFPFIFSSLLGCDFEITMKILGSLRYWYDRNKVDILVSKSAVWDDGAASVVLDCAAYWVKGLPFVKSLAGYWKFVLVQSPNNVPVNFHDSSFQDSTWNTIPGSIEMNLLVLISL